MTKQTKATQAKMGNLASLKGKWYSKDHPTVTEMVGKANGAPVITQIFPYLGADGTERYAMQIAQSVESLTSGGSSAPAGFRICAFVNNNIQFAYEYGRVADLRKRKVTVGDKSGPLMVAMQRTTASLAKCFEGETRKILYPAI